jgi:hypothetical protein
VPGPFQRDGQPSLVLGAGAGLASWFDLPSLREIAAQPADIFVIYAIDLIDAESTDLPARRVARSSALSSRPPWPLRSALCGGQRNLLASSDRPGTALAGFKCGTS